MRMMKYTSFTALAFLAAALVGCSRTAPIPTAVQGAGADAAAEPPKGAEKGLPPAYLRNQITDPGLREVADEFKTWALGQHSGPDKAALYSRVEILPPAQTVQPYGVGAYQQEPRLPVILTTGPGWAPLKTQDKEAQVAKAFRDIAGRLEALKHKPPLRPTLTIQTPQGMELGWINHLNPDGKNLHDE